MAKQIALKILQCPTCGGPLKAENNTDAVTCVYCGNSVVPVTTSEPTAQNENAGFRGVVRVEGIKTSSSALAYMEEFFEEYDWEAFAYAQTLSVAEMDKLANSLRVSSADDKNTWLACFKATFVPYTKKLLGCKNILSAVIEEYKKNNLDSYSRFDAYKRIVAILISQKDEVIAVLEKYVDKAEKYGATAEELHNVRAQVDIIRNTAAVKQYDAIEDIPEITTFAREKNAKILAELAAEGIDAEKEYARAKSLLNQKEYVQALNILIALRGYSDTRELIEKIDKYFLISDVLEIEGNMYYFAEGRKEENSLNLYPAYDGQIAAKPIIKNIGKMVSNHADVLYYLDDSRRLQRYFLSTGAKDRLSDEHFSKDSIFVYGCKVFLLTADTVNDWEYTSKRSLWVLDLARGSVDKVMENVADIRSLTRNIMVYTTAEKVTMVLDVDTMSTIEIGTKDVTVEGDYVIYTQLAPNQHNKSLYVKSLTGREPAKLVEQNIFAFSGVLAGKLFYYIGNSRNKTLVNINWDGTDRKEWPLYISELLFEQGGWVYFIRRAGHNAILCKSCLDGSKFSVIAADIDRFIKLKNGYLYYINDESTLVKVRMDGSNLQELCEDVEMVLSVREDKIIFISVDDRIQPAAYEIHLCYRIFRKRFDETGVRCQVC